MFAVIVSTFARRFKRDWRRSGRWRTSNESNRSNRERCRVLHHLLIRDYLRLHRGGVGRGSGVGRDRGVGLGLGVGVGVGVTFTPDCTSNDPMSM